MNADPLLDCPIGAWRVLFPQAGIEGQRISREWYAWAKTQGGQEVEYLPSNYAVFRVPGIFVGRVVYVVVAPPHRWPAGVPSE